MGRRNSNMPGPDVFLAYLDKFDEVAAQARQQAEPKEPIIQAGIIRLPNRPPAMLAKDVAEFYGVPIRRLNEARQRNAAKFPGDDFCYQLTKEEVAKCDLSINSGNYMPWAYTKKGAHMFSTILNTPAAIERALLLVEIFVKTEEAALHHAVPGEVGLSKDRYIELLEAENRLLKQPKPVRKKSVPLTNELICKIYDLLSQGLSGRAVADELGISSGTVSFVRKLRPAIPLLAP